MADIKKRSGFIPFKTWPISERDTDIVRDNSTGISAVRADVAGTLHFISLGGTTDSYEIDAKTWEQVQIKQILTATTATGIHGGRAK